MNAVGEARRILLVEDDASIREGVTDLLALEGYPVEAVGNGEQALAWLSCSGTPALILLDLLMPVMNGAQLIERLNADPRLAAIPVVVMSAALPAAAHLPPASAYLVKPFDLADLMAAVEQHCGPPADSRA